MNQTIIEATKFYWAVNSAFNGRIQLNMTVGGALRHCRGYILELPTDCVVRQRIAALQDDIVLNANADDSDAA